MTAKIYTVTLTVRYQSAPVGMKEELELHMREALEAGTIMEDEAERAVVSNWILEVEEA